MDMLALLKSRLPADLEIVKTKGRTSSNQIEITFNHNGQEVRGWLNKVCAPGYAELICDKVIYNVLISAALDRNDVAGAKKYYELMNELGA